MSRKNASRTRSLSCIARGNLFVWITGEVKRKPRTGPCLLSQVPKIRILPENSPLCTAMMDAQPRSSTHCPWILSSPFMRMWTPVPPEKKSLVCNVKWKSRKAIWNLRRPRRHAFFTRNSSAKAGQQSKNNKMIINSILRRLRSAPSPRRGWPPGRHTGCWNFRGFKN